MFRDQLKTPVEPEGPPRIVVLPFENLGSAEDEYFADGITEEITSRLAAVSGIQVISRTSAQRYEGTDKSVPEIGEELDVGFVLEGTIRWDRGESGHGRVRITPQLINVADDSHLWSERYDRMLEDIFTVQSEIAEQVIAQHQASILESEHSAVSVRPTQNMEAYQAYLEGIRHLRKGWSEHDAVSAVAKLQRAVALDPEFAEAHAKLSLAHSAMYAYMHDVSDEQLQLAKASADRALELKPGLPEGHHALGQFFQRGLADYDRANEQISIALTSLPNDADLLEGKIVVKKRQGRWYEALEAIERLRQVDPQSHTAAIEASIVYMTLRRYREALEEVRLWTRLAPNDSFSWMYGAAIHVLWEGSTDNARHFLESAPRAQDLGIEMKLVMFDRFDRRPASALRRLQKFSPESFSSFAVFSTRELMECICLFEMGEVQAAETACRSTLEQLEELVDDEPLNYFYHIALGKTRAYLGLRKEAVRAAERAAELMPNSRDAVAGTDTAVHVAKIYARAGETDRVLDLIDQLLSIPCELSVPLIRLDPAWDPLRDNPRFQEILEKYGEGK